MTNPRQLEELKSNILRTIRARRITLGGFALVALVVKLTSSISYLNPLFYSPLVWFLLTFPFEFIIARQTENISLQRANTAFFAVEVGLITVIVHFMGGSEWIGIVFYLFTVIYANFFLPRSHGYVITALAIAGFSGLVFLEYWDIVPHRTLFAVSERYHNLPYNLTTVLAGAVGLYSILAYTVRSFTDIYVQKNEALARNEDQLRRLSQRLLSVQDEERQRIARHLHDQLGQSLAAVRLRLAASTDLSEEDEDEVGRMVDDAIEQTRALAYSLRPPLLDELGLIPSLNRLVDVMRSATDIELNLQTELSHRPDKRVERILYGTAQEALRNAQQHAHCTRIDVTVTGTPATTVLRVTDDGTGFDPDATVGLGLQGIRERVEMVGGTLSIRSRLQIGTTLTVEVPHDPRSDR